jgi:hypothetical protein
MQTEHVPATESTARDLPCDLPFGLRCSEAICHQLWEQRRMPIPPTGSRVYRHIRADRDGSHFFSAREARRDAYQASASDERQRDEEKWPRPFGLRRKSSHTSLSASALEPPKPSASASSGSIFARNAAHPYMSIHPKPNWSCRTLLNTRRACLRRAAALGRIGHGTAGAAENLRGVRKLVLPHRSRWSDLLPRM